MPRNTLWGRRRRPTAVGSAAAGMLAPMAVCRAHISAETLACSQEQFELPAW